MLYAPDGMITEGIHDHYLWHNFLPDVEDLYPSDDIMQEMMDLALTGEDEEGVRNLQDYRLSRHGWDGVGLQSHVWI